MQKITPHLWYDKEAKEAAELYTSIFRDSRIKRQTVILGTPSGDAETIVIELAGQEFILLSAGPYFKFNPSISFLVACATKEEVDMFWDRLSIGGKALMEIGSYPFSDRYGWIQDKFGVSWQIMYAGTESIRQKITPMLLFVGDNCGRAEEAIDTYISIFHDSQKGDISRYGEGEEPNLKGTVNYGRFTIEGQQFVAMDSALEHDFSFNEAVSLVVHCDTQEEIDYYWEKLSAVPEAEQCGWLKDKFGVSWQIVPSVMDEIMGSGDAEKLARVTRAFLKMKKFDIAELQRAAEGH